MFLLFDTETGGLEPATASLLTGTLFAVDRTLKIVDELDFKLKSSPYLASPEALKVNGINLEEHDKVAEENSSVTDRINRFLGKHAAFKSQMIPMGHNVAFDIKFVKYHLPNVSWDRYMSFRMLDTHCVAFFCQHRGLLPASLTKLSLVNLASYFGIPHNAHDARGDVEATLQVYKNLLELKEPVAV